MNTARETRIRDRARLLWEMEGRPNGRDLEHWLLAEHLVELEEGRLGSSQALADFATERAHERERPRAAEVEPSQAETLP